MRSRVLQSTPEGSSQAGGHGHYLKSQVKTTDPHFPTPQLGDHLSHSPEGSGFYYSPTRKTPVGAAVAGGRSWAQDRLDGEGPESNAGPTPGRSPRAGSLPGALSSGGTRCRHCLWVSDERSQGPPNNSTERPPRPATAPPPTASQRVLGPQSAHDGRLQPERQKPGRGQRVSEGL